MPASSSSRSCLLAQTALGTAFISTLLTIANVGIGPYAFTKTSSRGSSSPTAGIKLFKELEQGQALAAETRWSTNEEELQDEFPEEGLQSEPETVRNEPPQLPPVPHLERPLKISSVPLRIGFPDDRNSFPYLGHEGGDTSYAELAKIFAGEGRDVEPVLLDKDGTKSRDEKHMVDLSTIDVMFGLGWFFDKSLKEKRKELFLHLKEGNKLPANITGRWIDGVRWPRLESRTPRIKGSRNYTPYLIAYSGEAFAGGDCSTYDVLIDAGGAIDRRKKPFGGCATVFALSAFRNIQNNYIKYNVRSLLLDRSKIPTKEELSKDLKKKGFCGFLAKTCYHTVYTPQVSIRPAFFDILSEYKPAMAIANQGGKGCRVKNTSDPVEPMSSGIGIWDAAVETYKRYKFVITFENRQFNGYLTEKILNALLAGVIPIYFGAPDAAKYLNPKRFIFCDVNAEQVMKYSFPGGKKAAEEDPEPLISYVKSTIGEELRKCADRVKEVDQDDDLYHSIISEPILNENQLKGSEFDIQILMERIRRAINGHHAGFRDY